jgi:hypothetical protein
MTNRIWIRLLAIIVLCLPLGAIAQSDGASSSCPVDFVGFNASGLNGVSVRVRNPGAKKIVGLTFNAALADATEHWNWLSWPSDYATLREFGWNKELKPGAAKTTWWENIDLGHEHGGGVAFVLVSALFEDGSRWDERPDRATCVALWYNYHKKGIARVVVLPPRPPVQAHTLHFTQALHF